MNAAPAHPHRRGGASRQLERAIFGFLLLLLLWLPWPWGSHHSTPAAVAGLAAGLLVAVWMSLYASGRLAAAELPGAARWALVLWAAWLGWIALQLLPLPMSLLRFISPAAAEVHQAAALLPDTRAWFCLSIAPGATVDAGLLSLTYFCIYGLVLMTAGSRRRARALLLTLVAAGFLQAIYAIHMTLSGMEYGFFAPKEHNVGLATGTFVNRNHLAAYLVLTLSAGIGLVLSELEGWRGRNWRALARETVQLIFSTRFRVRILMVVMVIALVLTRSRMGNIAFVASLCACGCAYLLLRHHRWLMPGLILFISILLVDLWIVSDWFGLERVIERIGQTDLAHEGRPLILQDLLPAVRTYALTGAGLGAFVWAHEPFRTEEPGFFYDHAHNEYVEWIIESGGIGLLILLALALLHAGHAVRILRNRRDMLRVGAAFACLMALCAAALHATAEFALRIPAVTATLISLMALCASCSSRASGAVNPDARKGL